MLPQASTLKVSVIVPGKNPRRFFDEKEMAELESSVAAQGIIQPILVRPVGDVFEIVAGERRWRAANKVYGLDYDMPVLIKEMSDEEAAAAGANENMIRAGMSPAEEAEIAAKILAQHKGDYDEAAKRLGWTRSTLEKRLSLMQCSQTVRDALVERKINLGHAELFATAPKDKQDTVLEKLLKLPAIPTVAEFKALLQQHTKVLDAAIFDKGECAGCQYNSSNQSQLFAETVSGGQCTNSPCYDSKTQAELNLRSEALKDEYPTVKIVRPGENFLQIKIVVEGATGVGEAQAKACRGCSNFGAAVSGIPGSEGNVYRDQCFDTVCNSNKVAERIKAEKAEAAAQAKPAAKNTSQDDDNHVTKAAEKTETKVAVSDPARVKEYRVKVWRKIMRLELFANKDANLNVLLAMSICGLGKHMSKSKLTKALNKLTGSDISSSAFHNIGTVALLVSSSSEEVKARLHQALAASIEDDVEEVDLRQILTFLNADMSNHWQLNKEYLDNMTKSEIDLVADEIGLKAHIGKDYSKLMNGKKDDIISALLAVEGFDYHGKIPKVMYYNV